MGFDAVQSAPISSAGEALPRFGQENVVGRTGRTYAAGVDMALMQMWSAGGRGKRSRLDGRGSDWVQPGKLEGRYRGMAVSYADCMIRYRL